MKKLCFLLILALLLSLGASAFADGGLEIIIVDGIPIAFESFALEAGDDAVFYAGAPAGFTLPAALVTIEESAFEGISARRVEITENVRSIGARAFADCENLTELVIPATVESIDSTALAGSENVTVYGATGSVAERFADVAKVPFVATDVQPEHEQPQPPVGLPYVEFD